MNTPLTTEDVADADVAELASRIDWNAIDLQAQLESFGQKALETIDRLQEAKRALLREIRAHERWLVERVDWLKYEIDHGGNFQYLNNKREETEYCLKKLRAHVTALTASKEQP